MRQGSKRLGFTRLRVLRARFTKTTALHLEDLLGALLHAGPDLVAETPQRVELEDGVDALAGLLVMELGHHHFGHRVGDLHGAQEEHGSWREKRQDGKVRWRANSGTDGGREKVYK